MIWNARGIRSKFLELFHFILLNNILISLISETHLENDDTISDPNFKIYRLDRNHHGGGVALIVNTNVLHELLPCPRLRVVEAIALKLNIGGRRIIVVAVYFPGSYDPEVLRLYRLDLQTLSDLGSNVILGGDLNSRHSFWGCQRSNPAGNILFQEVMCGDLSLFFPDSPTHFPASGHTPSVIDGVLSKGSFEPQNVRTGDCLSSDHLPVFFDLKDTLDSSTPSKYLVKDYSRADWSAFGNYTSRKLASRPVIDLQSSQQIDDAIKFLEETIRGADTHSIPRKERRYGRTEINNEILSLIRRRRAANRRWRRTYDPSHRSEAKELAVQIKTAMDNLVNERFTRAVVKLDRDPGPFRKKFWRLIKNLRKKSSAIPPLRTDQGVLLTPSEKCEAFANHLSTLPTTPNYRGRIKFEREVNSCIDTIDNMDQSCPVPQISLNELKAEIACLKSGKSPGIDLVDNKHLKHLPELALLYLLQIFNACLRLGYFPTRWKESLVSCICKPGKPKDQVKSYRMISLLPDPGKLFERLILNFVTEHLDDNDSITPEQFGFRKGKSCTHQLYRVAKRIRTGLSNRMSTGMLSLDLTSAFDCVWHNGLLYKMLNLEFPPFLLKLTRSFLRDRSFTVSINGARSTPRRVEAGVPQGAVLSPTFFNVYLYDIPFPPKGDVALLADDTAFLTSSHRTSTIVNRLQRASDQFVKYFTRWKVNVNGSKSQVTLFTKKTAPRHTPVQCVRVGNDQVQWKDTLVYLGVTLNKRMTYGPHILSKIDKTQRTVKSLYSVINRNSRLSAHNKIFIFKTVIRPGFTYASPVWKHCAASHMKRLQILQNKILKMMLNKPRRFPTTTLHSLANVETVQHHVDRLWVNFESNCLNNVNQDVVSLINDPP